MVWWLFHRCTMFGQFFLIHFENLGPFVLKRAILNLFDSGVEPGRLVGKMRSLRTTDIEGDEIRRNVGNADRRAHAAHDTIHKHLGNALEVAENGLPDPFPHIDFLRTGLGAGITISAQRRFRIEIEQILFGVLKCLNVVRGLPGREGWHHRK